MKTPIELEYDAYVRGLYDKLREDWNNGTIGLQDARAVAQMILERTGVSDPNPGAWDASSWCAETWDDSGCSEGDDGWDSSGCAF